MTEAKSIIIESIKNDQNLTVGLIGLAKDQSYSVPVMEIATNFCHSGFHSRWVFEQQKYVWENSWAVANQVAVTDKDIPSSVKRAFFWYVEEEAIPRESLDHDLCAITIQKEIFYVQQCRPWVTLRRYLNTVGKTDKDKVKGESLEVPLEGEVFYIPARYVNQLVPLFHDHHSWGGGDRTAVEAVSSGISYLWDGVADHAHIVKSEILETSGRVEVFGKKTFMGI